MVNQFFNNKIRYVPDDKVWGVPEYWATPGELIACGAGDCEDSAIAKYFTLVESGVDEDCLKIVCARLLDTGQAHMTLFYQDSFVLDNLIGKILTTEERSDLLPVLGFNRRGVWLFTQGEPKMLTRHPGKLKRWRKLLARIKQERDG